VQRIERIFFVLACLLVALVSIDAASGWGTWHGVREGDSVLLVLAALFFGLALWRPNAARRVSVSIVFGLLSLALLETSLTLATRDASRPERWYVWPPNYSCQTIPRDMPGLEGDSQFTINSRGLRAREFSSSDSQRILCVGGSTTECFYVDDQDTWPAQLEALLAPRRPDVWVGNAGRSGLTSFDHVTLLTHLPEAQQVDTWIVLCGVNDLSHHLSGEYPQGCRETMSRTFCYRRPGFSGRLERPLYRNTYTFSLIDQSIRWARMAWKTSPGQIVQDREAAWYADVRQRRAAAEEKVDQLPDLREALAEYQRNLDQMIALARQHDKRLILATQPVLWTDNMPPSLEGLCWGGRTRDGQHYYTTAALSRGMEAFNQCTRDACLRSDVPCVDLSRELPTSTAVFYDDCHFNRSGCQAVAVAMATALEPGSPAGDPGDYPSPVTRPVEVADRSHEANSDDAALER
jgi:lysophospholipase L1-like esterase